MQLRNFRELNDYHAFGSKLIRLKSAALGSCGGWGQKRTGEQGRAQILNTLPLSSVALPGLYFLLASLLKKKKSCLYPLSYQNSHLSLIFINPRCYSRTASNHRAWLAKGSNSFRFSLPDHLSPTGDLEPPWIACISTEHLSSAAYHSSICQM